MVWAAPPIHTVGDVLTASDVNTISNDLDYCYGDAIQTTAAFTNGWANLGLPYGPARFRKIGSRVNLAGIVTGGASGTSIFTLPAQYLPPYSVEFVINSGNVFGILVVSAAGLVTPSAGTSFITLDGVSFDTI